MLHFVQLYELDPSRSADVNLRVCWSELRQKSKDVDAPLETCEEGARLLGARNRRLHLRRSDIEVEIEQRVEGRRNVAASTASNVRLELAGESRMDDAGTDALFSTAR